MSKLSNNDPVYYKTRTVNLLKNAIENGVEIEVKKDSSLGDIIIFTNSISERTEVNINKLFKVKE